MNNEIKRKITSLMLMTVMVAGGMTFAIPGMEPAYASEGELTVSAQEIGNFAGIQVIEIVVDDPDRSETNETEGKPNVELNGDDVLMSQGTDGAWYAYVANNIAVEAYQDEYGLDGIWDNDAESTSADVDGASGATIVYVGLTAFLDGSPALSGDALNPVNNETDQISEWPYVQAYDISKNSDVTITYGSGSTAETITLEYEYDNTKDIVLDRSSYPENGKVNITLDDSLLNLSPTADEIWSFETNIGEVYFEIDGQYTNTVDWDLIGFEEGPIQLFNDNAVVEFSSSTISGTYDEVNDNVIVFKTSNTDDNVFVNWNNDEQSGLTVVKDGEASISYNDAHSILFDTFNGVISFENPIEEWLSGIELDIILTDEDRNLNSRSDETLSIQDGEVPFIEIGSPLTLADADSLAGISVTGDINFSDDDLTESKTLEFTIDAGEDTIDVKYILPSAYETAMDNDQIFAYASYDLREFGAVTPSDVFYIGQWTTDSNSDSPAGVTVLTSDGVSEISFDLDTAATDITGTGYIDIMFFGQNGELVDSGAPTPTGDILDNVDRVNDAIYRFELEETDDNTGKYDGTVEYIMINQLNIFDVNTYDSIETNSDTVKIIVNDDMDGTDAVNVSYNDISSTTDEKIISAQEDANTHTGVITLDDTGYSSGNTITVTLDDVDLNTNSDTIQTYTVNSNEEWVGNDDVWLSKLLIDNVKFEDGCPLLDDDGNAIVDDNGNAIVTDGLSDTGFTLTETSDASGIFVGTLKLPTYACDADDEAIKTNGLDLEFEYQDYSDASGKSNESSDSASIRSNTGSIALDRTTYPVPIGTGQFDYYDETRGSLDVTGTTFVIQINDPDFNISSSGEDTLSIEHLKMTISRGSNDLDVDVGIDDLVETDPASGIFEIEVTVEQDDYNDTDPDADFKGQIHQGDIISVVYNDPNDASGDDNSVTDSATFDLRNAVLQTDKSVYIIGSDAIVTLIEADLNLDSETAETWPLELINWDSDAGDEELDSEYFNAQPSGLRETGDDTGVFQVVIEIPSDFGGDSLERGEQITLEYRDDGPAGADYVGDDDEDISIDIFTSNFGATVELDQKVYTWTDKVYVTIVSPDHNFDSDAIDEIGGNDNEINIATRSSELEFYQLVETGTDTGIFTGELILTGFAHDANGDGNDDPSVELSDENSGPTDGFLPTSDDDGISVSFESSDGKVVIGSALIRWNIGEVQWLEASYPASGSGVIRVIDPDMNLNPEAVDSFDANIWSDTAVGGITLRVTETNEATGIFEGTVFFTVTAGSSGSRLAVSEGDTVTAEYEDRTLPDPYSTTDVLDVTATTLIGTIVPPLERAPAGHLQTVDAFGNSLDTVQVDQQVQLQADIQNGQDRDQEFAYLVQIQDDNGVTVELAWLTGSLNPGQSFSPALSWIPTELGKYTATVFVWESVDNPTALSPPLSTVITIN